MKSQGKGRSTPKQTAESPREELVRELKHLRTVIREAGEAFILRKEGEIEALIAGLAGVPAARVRREGPSWLRSIRSHGAKPEKGRLRDLRGLSKLMDGLADEVLAAQTPKTQPPAARTRE
jgi:hypothetical protein